MNARPDMDAYEAKVKAALLAEIKAKILATPELVMTPELTEREKALAAERAETLRRRLVTKHH